MSKDKGKPEYGVEYRLTGGKDVKSIAGGFSWAESRVHPDLLKLLDDNKHMLKEKK